MYRSSIHETTGQTPCALAFGREIRLPIDVMFGEVQDTGIDLASRGILAD